jgi:hypothetical protein
MGERAGVVVSEGAAFPLADMDVAKWSLGIADRGDRKLHKNCKKSEKKRLTHKSCPQPLTQHSTWMACTKATGGG